MYLRKIAAVAGAAVLVLAAAGCHGGGKPAPTVVINSINLNPGTVGVGSTVQLSASLTGADASALKAWSVSAGDLSVTQPDLAFVLRSTAKSASASSVSTTNGTVYWTAPATPGGVNITLTVGSATKTLSVTVGSSVVSMDVTDGAGGKKVATIKVNSVTDLYQAAFRVQFTSAWTPESITYGNFLGASTDVVTLGLTNQAGFVPVAISRKGNVSGVDGSGTLATITFAPSSGTSSVRGASSVPFDVTMVQLRNSQGQPISNGS
jgi:hypothetical protein